MRGMHPEVVAQFAPMIALPASRSRCQRDLAAGSRSSDLPLHCNQQGDDSYESKIALGGISLGPH